MAKPSVYSSPGFDFSNSVRYEAPRFKHNVISHLCCPQEQLSLRERPAITQGDQHWYYDRRMSVQRRYCVGCRYESDGGRYRSRQELREGASWSYIYPSDVLIVSSRSIISQSPFVAAVLELQLIPNSPPLSSRRTWSFMRCSRAGNLGL
jgi:hypothetical protein